MKVEKEDIAFWMLIGAALVVIIWLLHGSPTVESSIVTIGLFIISSEIMLWKKYFSIDKAVAVMTTKMEQKFVTIGDKLADIEQCLQELKK